MMKIKGSGNSEERQAPEREQFHQSQFPSPSPTTPSRRAACTVASCPAPLALSHQIVSPSPLCVSLLYSASSLSPLLFLKPQPLPMSGPRTSKQCGQTPHPLHVPLPLPRPLPYPLRLSMSAPRTRKHILPTRRILLLAPRRGEAPLLWSQPSLHSSRSALAERQRRMRMGRGGRSNNARRPPATTATVTTATTTTTTTIALFLSRP